MATEFVGTAIDRVWDAISRLTYAEMLELASSLRDSMQNAGTDAGDAYAVAQAIDAAREAQGQPDAQ